MSIESAEELAGLRTAGAIVRLMLERMKEAVRPGVSTSELDKAGAEVMLQSGARSAPRLVYGFPGVSCISVNDEVVHGIPGARRLREGDLVKLDVTVEKDGFMADAAVTVPVGKASGEAERLIACAENAFRDAMKFATAGRRVFEIGKAVERRVRETGFSVIRELGGHGIGRTIHEDPSVPNYHDPRADQVLSEGLVITVEPIIAAGGEQIFLAKDGWTLRTADQSKSAHFEQTIVITNGWPILLTAEAAA